MNIRQFSKMAFLVGAFAPLLALTAHAQLADAAGNFQDGTVGDVMNPLADTHGTGTWTYNLAFVNTDSDPTGVSGQEPLTWVDNTIGGPGSSPFYGTTSSYSYSVINLPAVSNQEIFNDSPAPGASGGPGADYLEMHPGGDTAASDLQWTAGAGETGTLSLTFDLSRVNVGSGGLSGSAGYDDFTIYQNGTLLYHDYDMFIGSDTGLQTLTLTGVTSGTTLDFVVSATNGVLGYNLAYLKADIAVPEPSTYALLGLSLLAMVPSADSAGW
jgi:hypothetical protein